MDAEEGIAASLRAADEEWKRFAYQTICDLAEALDEYNTDEVFDWMEETYPDVTTSNYSAIGGLFRAAMADGIIEPVIECDGCGKFKTRKSKRDTQHRDKTLYRKARS